MRFALTTLASTALCSMMAAPAFAGDCTHVVYGNVADGYVLQDIALMATEEPVFQGGITRTCGRWSLDFWTSTELSGEGEYGDRGFGDEVDFTVNFDDQFDTPIGSVNIQVSGAYYLLADLGDFNDDMVQVYVDASRPITAGPFTFTPFVRVLGWAGIANATLTRYGIRPSVALGDGWSLSGDISHTENHTMKYEVDRGQITAAKAFDNGLTFSVTGKFTEDVRNVWGVGFSKSF